MGKKRLKVESFQIFAQDIEKMLHPKNLPAFLKIGVGRDTLLVKKTFQIVEIRRRIPLGSRYRNAVPGEIRYQDKR